MISQSALNDEKQDVSRLITKLFNEKGIERDSRMDDALANAYINTLQIMGSPAIAYKN